MHNEVEGLWESVLMKSGRNVGWISRKKWNKCGIPEHRRWNHKVGDFHLFAYLAATIFMLMVADHALAAASNPVARIANSFLIHARYEFTANQQLILAYLVSGVNPFGEKLYQVDIPVKNFEKLLKPDENKKWGSFGERLDSILSNLIGKKVRFPSGVMYDGYELPDEVVWIQSRKTFLHKETNEPYIRFKFGEDMVPFLIGLKKYAQIHVIEVRPMTSRFAVRLFLCLKAQREEERKYKRVTRVEFGLEELKDLLGVVGKYTEFKDFNRYVLKKSIKQINEFTSIKITDLEKLRTGRAVTALAFTVIDQKVDRKVDIQLPEAPESQLSLFDMAPEDEEINHLSYAQYLAYVKLIEEGVYEGVAFRKILPTIKGSEVEGFEDQFVQLALEHVQKKSRHYNAGVLVDWWVNKKTFSAKVGFGDVWAKITEQVIAYKKQQQQGSAQGIRQSHDGQGYQLD